MEIDWSLVFSCVTAAAAVVALLFSACQIRQSNKQHLFDRRIRAWSISQSLIELYENERTSLLERSDGPEFGNDLQFVWLTNNSFLCGISEVVSHVLEEDRQRLFLQKMEELKGIAVEVTLIFKKKPARLLGDFLQAYQALLFAMYQYSIMLNSLERNAERFHWTLEEAVEKQGEEKIRCQLYKARDGLQNAYEALTEKEVQKRIEKQIRLSRWS